MESFNADQYDKYIASRNYYEAAKYLNQYIDPHNENARELYNEVDQLNRQGDLQNAFLGQLDTQGKQAYYFASAIQNKGRLPFTQKDDKGNIDLESINDFGDKYKGLLKDLKVTNQDSKLFGQNIDKINIKLTDNGYQSLLNNLGITDKDINELDLTYHYKNGQHSLSIPTSSINLHKVLKATYDLDNRWSYVGSQTSGYAIAGGMLGSAAGSFVPGIGNATVGIIGMVGGAIGGFTGALIDYESPFEIEGVSNGAIVNKDEFNEGNLKDIVKLGDKAIEINEENKKKIETVELESDVDVVPFRGYGDMMLMEQLKAGRLDIDTYKKLKDIADNQYDMAVAGMSLVNYEVYALDNNSKNAVMRKIDKDSERLELTRDIQTAFAENRLTQQMALNNGDYGVLFTISAASDNKKERYTSGNGQDKYIFVPGNVFHEYTAEQYIKSDTRFKAQQDNADIKRFNYAKPVSDGTYVGYDRVGKYHYLKDFDADGNTRYSIISEDEALEKFHKENCLKDATRSITLKALNNDLTDSEIQDEATNISKIIVNDLFNRYGYTNLEKQKQQQLIVAEILKRLNVPYNTKESSIVNSDNQEQ